MLQVRIVLGSLLLLSIGVGWRRNRHFTQVSIRSLLPIGDRLLKVLAELRSSWCCRCPRLSSVLSICVSLRHVIGVASEV